jgi:glycosyltransferase involved in cell wall biosynthesis
VTSGKIEPRKDVDLLLRAFARAALPEGARLALVGDGPAEYRDRIEKLARELGVAERLISLPLQPNRELPALYGAATLGVWAGDGSIGILEAMGCGLPVIVSTAAGSDYVAGAPGVAIVARGDADALAAAMRRAVEDASPARRAATAAFVEERLSWSAIAAEAVRYYREAASS